MINLTSELVLDYHEYMAKKLKAIVIYKPDAPEMQAAAWALDLMGITSKKYFLEHFAMTVGRRIYVPWEPGDAGSTKGLAFQVRVLAHECQHVVQYRNDERFALRYLLSKSRRAHYEAQAMHCDLELFHYIYGKPMAVERLTQHLKHYRIRRADRAVARQDLEIYNQAVERKQISTKPGKAAIRWLQKRIK